MAVSTYSVAAMAAAFARDFLKPMLFIPAECVLLPGSSVQTDHARDVLTLKNG